VKKALFIALAVVTIVLSVIFSQIYYKLALTMVPPAAMSALTLGAGRLQFALYGVGFGLLAAVLEGVVFWIATRTRR
jgi:hypothetical protein